MRAIGVQEKMADGSWKQKFSFVEKDRSKGGYETEVYLYGCVSKCKKDCQGSSSQANGFTIAKLKSRS